MKITFTLVLLILSSSLLAKTPRDRVELMKYVIKQEGKMRFEAKWEEVSWFQKLKLIEEAHAYKEGETCLVLGFKSQFKNGMCRLSYAEDAKDYKKQCGSDSLPCNPQVFGKPSSDQPFCVSKSAGRELSKACAKETFNHLAQTSKSPALKDVEKTSLKKFDLDKIDLSEVDGPLAEAFKSVFSGEDASLDAAIDFTKGLCEDLKLSTQSGHQPLDLKTCQNHLALLEKGKLPEEASDKKEKEEKNPEEEVVVEKKKVTVDESGSSTANVPTDEECAVDPILNKETEENIEDVKRVAENEESKAWLLCVNKLEAHKIVAPKLKGISEYDVERDRYFGYWHQLNGEKQFGRLCEESSTEDTAVFSFLGSKGFTQVIVPATDIKSSVNRISSNGKEYYIVRDMLGDYFELIEKDKLTSAPKGTQEDIRNYHKKGGGKVNTVGPVPAEKLDEAKVCQRDRLEEYLDWITYPTEGIPPSVKDYNADVGTYNRGDRESLKEKYALTVDELKKDQFAKVMKDVPECKGILSEEAFSKNYEKDHAERIKLYNKMRGILGLGSN